MKPNTRRLFSSDSIYLAVVLLPIILMIALFIYYPAVDTFGQSLTNRNLRIRRPPKPVGWPIMSNWSKTKNSGR